MKTKILLLLVVALTLTNLYTLWEVELPEEYQEITKKDNLRGYWKNGVLYIEFDNEPNEYLTVYTSEDIYYIDVRAKEVKTETGLYMYFKDSKELATYIEHQTAKDNNP